MRIEIYACIHTFTCSHRLATQSWLTLVQLIFYLPLCDQVIYLFLFFFNCMNYFEWDFFLGAESTLPNSFTTFRFSLRILLILRNFYKPVKVRCSSLSSICSHRSITFWVPYYNYLITFLLSLDSQLLEDKNCCLSLCIPGS